MYECFILKEDFHKDKIFIKLKYIGGQNSLQNIMYVFVRFKIFFCTLDIYKQQAFRIY